MLEETLPSTPANIEHSHSAASDGTSRRLRRLLFVASLVFILSATGWWHWRSPGLAQYFALGLLKYRPDKVAAWMVDPHKFSNQIVRELRPLFDDPDVRTRLSEKGVTPGALLGVIGATLPAVIVARGASAGESELWKWKSLGLLAGNALGIEAPKLARLGEEWTSSQVKFGECKVSTNRGACTVSVVGSSAEAELATLWERERFAWKLVGVAGIGQLISQLKVDTP